MESMKAQAAGALGDARGRPLHDLRISVTDRCNFRCVYCMPKEIFGRDFVFRERSELLSFEEIERLARISVSLGVTKLRLTGGEPLLHRDLPELLGKIKALGYKIKLDTNGSNPELLRGIIENRLVDRVAMDIKNAPEAYGETVGVTGFDISPIAKSKDMLLFGDIDYEFRTTVVKGIHTKESLLEAAKWIAGAKEYYLQQFKDSGNLILPGGLAAYDEKDMHALADAVREYVPAVQVRGV